MAQLTTKPLSWFKTNPQVRKTFDEAELRLLGESLRHKQLQPVLAKPDGTIIAGERRYRAAKLADLPNLMVIVTEEPLTDAEVRAIQLTENIHRADLTGYEKWQACKELLELNPGWQGKDLAEHLHLDPSSVTRLLSPSKCIVEAKRLCVTARSGFLTLYALRNSRRKTNRACLALKLSGGSRDALEQAGRKKRAGNAPAVRVPSIKVPLANGVSVVVKGEAIDLEQGIEALKDAIKAMTKARDTWAPGGNSSEGVAGYGQGGLSQRTHKQTGKVSIKKPTYAVGTSKVRTNEKGQSRWKAARKTCVAAVAPALAQSAAPTSRFMSSSTSSPCSNAMRKQSGSARNGKNLGQPEYERERPSCGRNPHP